MSLYQIDLSKNKIVPKLYLSKPNRDIISPLNEAYDIKLNLKLGGINEIYFTVPSEIEKDFKKVKNPNLDKIKNKYMVQMTLGENYEEWFVIDSIEDSMDDQDDNKVVKCFSLGYELRRKRVKVYKTEPYTPSEVLQDIFRSTNANWSVGYLSQSIVETRRSFDVNNKRLLDFVFEVAESFDCIPLFDTVNRKVSLLKLEEIGEDKGLKFSYGKYIQSLNRSLKSDKTCTRLYVYGKNQMSIQRVNPTGQPYIDDFTYYMFPFKRDENKTVLKSSDYMSDELCNAILDYFELIESTRDNFRILLGQKEQYENQLTSKENEFFDLETELILILDSIHVAQQNNQSTTTLISARDDKVNQINVKKSEIDIVKNNISDVNIEIGNIKSQLSYGSNFSENLLDELSYFIEEEEYVNENYFDDEELYQKGLEELSKINKPELLIQTNIVNFLECIECQHDWGKLVLGDTVYVNHEKLSIEVESKIAEIKFDFENYDIDLVIADSQNIQTNEDQMIKLLYKNASTSNLVNENKTNWQSITTNFNNRNDRISVRPANPIVVSDGAEIDHTKNIDGSVNISFEWQYSNENDIDKYNIDGFLVYVKSQTSNTPYIFGSTISNEDIKDVNPDKRAIVIYGVPSNHYYTFGVQAYRRVDNDISSNGIIKSDIVQTLPYKPENNVVFDGDISGTIGGVPYDSVSKTPVSVIVADGSTSSEKSKKRADFIIPIGATNAQETINSAINSLPSIGGKVVLMEGTYTINNSILLRNDVTFEGQGRSTTIRLSTSTSNISILNISAKRNISISNLNLNVVTGMGSRACLRIIDQSSNITVNNLDCKGSATGIILANSSDVVIQNSNITTCSIGARVYDCSNITVINCGFYNNYSYGLALSGNNLLITNNTFKNNGYMALSTVTTSYTKTAQIFVTGSVVMSIVDTYAIKITNNIIEGGFRQPTNEDELCAGVVVLETNNVEITGNTILNHLYHGISLFLNVAKTTITENIMQDNGLANDNSYSHILLDGVVSGYYTGIRDTSIQNNNINYGNYIIYKDVLPSQLGLSLNQLKLPSNASNVVDYYKNTRIYLTSGTTQNKLIIGYNKDTKVLTLDSNLSSVPPEGASFEIKSRPKYGIRVHNADCISTLISNNNLFNSAATSSISDAGTNTSTGAGNRLSNGNWSTTIG